MEKIWGFVLQRIEYQILFYWQQHLEIFFMSILFLFLWEFINFAYIECIVQTTKNFAMDFFSYFVEEIMNTKICKTYRKIFF